MRRLAFCLLFVASVVSAQPKPRSAARVPTRPVPCVMPDSTLHTTGTDAVVCWDKGCMKLDFENTDATWLVKPAPQKSWQIPQAEVKDDQVCLGTTCKKLGKKLVAAIAAYKKDLDPSSSPQLEATSDLKAVAVGYDAVWNVQGDAKLKFTTPKLYARTGEKPTMSGIDVAGNLLVTQWSACAGPCTKFQITDSAGRPKGPEGDGGGEVFQLDAKRFAVVSEYATISLFDLATGKARGVVRLGAEPEQNTTIRADDSTIFTMFHKNDGVQVVKVTAYDDPAIPASADASMFLPNCQP
jgi:hypothetical protein